MIIMSSAFVTDYSSVIQAECCGIWKAKCVSKGLWVIPPSISRSKSAEFPKLHHVAVWQRGKEGGQFSDTKHTTETPAHSRASQFLLSFLVVITTQILRGGRHVWYLMYPLFSVPMPHLRLSHIIQEVINVKEC